MPTYPTIPDWSGTTGKPNRNPFGPGNPSAPPPLSPWSNGGTGVPGVSTAPAWSNGGTGNPTAPAGPGLEMPGGNMYQGQKAVAAPDRTRGGPRFHGAYGSPQQSAAQFGTPNYQPAAVATAPPDVSLPGGGMAGSTLPPMTGAPNDAGTSFENAFRSIFTRPGYMSPVAQQIHDRLAAQGRVTAPNGQRGLPS